MMSLNVNDDLDLCVDLKSPSSQESGLGTMLVIDDSLGSLEELSEGVQLQLNTHMDHTKLLQYELELLRAQLAEKNRLISSQQISIKQLQDALNASQRELNEFRRIAETELTCKTETISILQSDLADCQQQYAECFQQVVNQDRMLSEMRDDDAILTQKITFLESQLCKSNRDASTQTSGMNHQLFCSPRAAESASLSRSATFHQQPISFLRRPECQRPDRNSRKSVHGLEIQGGDSQCVSPTCRSLRKQEDKFVTVDLFQDLLNEIRQLNLQSNKQSDTPTSHQPHNPPGCQNGCPTQKNVSKTADWSEFVNTLTDEKQHRLQLEHSIRLMEIDMLDIRNQVQNCNSRLNNWPSKCANCQANPRCCSPAVVNTCCSCVSASTLYTLV